MRKLIGADAVRTFAAFLGQLPDQAEPEDLRRFQLHMAAQGASPAKMNAAVSALRFFFNITLGRVGFGDRLATVPSPERLPVVLSPEEVARLLGCAPGLSTRRRSASPMAAVYASPRSSISRSQT